MDRLADDVEAQIDCERSIRELAADCGQLVCALFVCVFFRCCPIVRVPVATRRLMTCKHCT
jgi:hypothetical protein